MPKNSLDVSPSHMVSTLSGACNQDLYRPKCWPLVQSISGGSSSFHCSSLRNSLVYMSMSSVSISNSPCQNATLLSFSANSPSKSWTGPE
eukprot:12691810-Ditylum_brightwellii.AAC.1